MAKSADVSTLLSAVTEEGNNGPSAFGTTVAPIVQNMVLTAFNNAYKVSQAMNSKDFALFKAWTKSEAIVGTAAAPATSQHPVLRLATNYLKYYIGHKYWRLRNTILLLNSTYAEYKDFIQMFPNCQIRCAIKTGGVRDTDRNLLSEAEALADSRDPTSLPIILAIANDFIRARNLRLRHTMFFTFYKDMEEIPNFTYDYMFNIDGMLDFHPDEYSRLMKRLQVKEFVATMHYCPELLWSGKKCIPSLYFEAKWKKTDGMYVMDPCDGSFKYTQSPNICRAWWHSNVIGNFYYDPIFANGGYGLFRFGHLEEGVYYSPVSLRSLTGVLRLPKVMPLFKYGKLEPIFVLESKYNALVDYSIQRFADSNVISWSAIVQFYRANKGSTSTVGKLVSGEWDLLDEDQLDIIMYAILDVSLKRQEVNLLFPHIASLIRNNGRFGFKKRVFGWKINRLVDWFTTIFSGPKVYEKLEAYKKMEVNSEVNFTGLVHSAKTTILKLEFNLREYLHVGGKEVIPIKKKLEYFKKYVLNYQPKTVEGLPHGHLKIAEFRNEFEGKVVLHLGVEPGWMIKPIASWAAELHLGIPSTVAFPRVRADGDIRWEAKFSPSLMNMDKACVNFKHNVFYKKKLTVLDILEDHAYELIFSDISCCNGFDCGSDYVGSGACINPIEWAAFWVEWVQRHGGIVIFKLNTSEYMSVLAKLNRYKRIKAELMPRSEFANPMSFEVYIKITKTTFPCFGLSEDALKLHMNPVVHKWNMFKSFDDYGELAIKDMASKRAAVEAFPKPSAPPESDDSDGDDPSDDSGVEIDERDIDHSKPSTVPEVIVDESIPVKERLIIKDKDGKYRTVRKIRKSPNEQVLLDMHLERDENEISISSRTGAEEGEIPDAARTKLVLQELHLQEKTKLKSERERQKQLKEEVNVLERMIEAGQPTPVAKERFEAPPVFINPFLTMTEVAQPTSAAMVPFHGMIKEEVKPNSNFQEEAEVETSVDEDLPEVNKEIFGILREDYDPDVMYASKLEKKFQMAGFEFPIDGSEGLCFPKALSAIYYGATEYYKQAWDKYIATAIPGLVIGSVTTHEMVVKVLNHHKIPYVDYVEAKTVWHKEANVVATSLFGAPILFHNHMDVVIQVPPGKSKLSSLIFKVHPYIRPFSKPDFRMFTFIPANFCGYSGMNVKDSVQKLISTLNDAPSEYTEVHKEAVDTLTPLANRVASPVKMFIIQGGPGSAKTETAMDYIRNCLTHDRTTWNNILYIGSSREARDELVLRYRKKFNVASHLDESKLGFHAKTFAAAFQAKPKYGYFPRTNIKVVIVDECYTQWIYYYTVLQVAFPKAEFLLLGDYNQFKPDPSKFGNASCDITKQDLKGFINRLRVTVTSNGKKMTSRLYDAPKYCGWFPMNVSKRFGPRGVHIAKKINPEATLYCDNFNPFYVKWLNLKEFQDELEKDTLVMVASTHGYKEKDQLPEAKSVRQCQGKSVEETLTVMDPTTVDSLYKFRETAYVNATRAKKVMKVFAEKSNLDGFNEVKRRLSVDDFCTTLQVKLEAIVGGNSPTITNVARNHVGGVHVREKRLNFANKTLKNVPLQEFQGGLPWEKHQKFDNEWLEECQLNGPVARLATEKNHVVLPKRPHVSDCGFSKADIGYMQFLENLEYGNMVEHMVADPIEVGKVRVQNTSIVGITKTGRYITETFHGNRHYVGSVFQNTATVVHRMGVAAKVQSKINAFRFNFESLAKDFRETFLDKAKYQEALSKPLLEVFEASAINDFREVMKMDDISNDMTMMQFTFRATEHLKNQIKAKDLESTMKHKLGQPIVAAEKAFNNVFSPMFRVFKKILIHCLDPKIIWASGYTPEQLAEMWSSPETFYKWIIMNDFPEYDASQTDKTNYGQFCIWLLMNPFGHLLKDYFKVVNNVIVLGATMAFVTTGQRCSGYPDTFDGNTLKQLLDWLQSGKLGKQGNMWFKFVEKMMLGGDDSMVATSLHPREIFSFDWLQNMLYGKLKMYIVTHGVGEFSNWIYFKGKCVYNPTSQIKKLLNKNYTSVFESEANWYVWVTAMKDLSWSIRDHFWESVEMVAIFHDWDRNYAEFILKIIDAYTRMNFSQALRILKPHDITLEDFYVGGDVKLEYQNSTLTTTKATTTTIKPTTATKMNSNGKLDVNPTNCVSAFNEHAMLCEQCRTRGETYAVSGESHCPVFTCKVLSSIDARLSENEGRGRTKAIAKNLAYSILWKKVLDFHSGYDDSKAPEITKVTSKFENNLSVTSGCARTDLFRDSEIDVLVIPEKLMAPLCNEYIDGKIQAVKMIFSNMMASFSLPFPWQCCECQTLNIADPNLIPGSQSVCRRCSNNVWDHQSVKLCYVYVGNRYVWVPKFGEVVKTVEVVKQKPKKSNFKRRKNSAKGEKALVTKELNKLRISTAKAKQANGKKYKRPSASRVSAKGLSALKLDPEVIKFLRTVANPYGAPPFRFAGEWSVYNTTTMNPMLKPTVPFLGNQTIATPAQQLLPTTESMAFLFNDPLCAIIYYDVNWGGNVYNYAMYGSPTPTVKGVNPATSWTLTLGTGLGTGGQEYITTGYAMPTTSASQPHGTLLPAKSTGLGNIGRFFPMGANDVIQFSVTAAGGTGTISFGVDSWSPDTEQITPSIARSLLSVTAPGTVATTITVPTFGYYAVWYNLGTSSYNTLTWNTISFYNAVPAGVWCHRMIPGFETCITSMTGIRVNGFSLMFTNSDAKLYIGGKIAQLQVPKGNHWTQFVYPAVALTPYIPSPSANFGFGKLNSLSEVDTRRAEQGSYMYYKPQGAADFEMQANWVIDNGVLMDCHSALTIERSFLAWSFSGQTSAQDGYFTIAYAVEALTTDTTRPVAKPTGNPSQIYMVQGALQQMQQYSENPSHIPMIINGIKKGINWITHQIINEGPRVIKGAKAVNSLISSF
jgi:hypothetical protein